MNLKKIKKQAAVVIRARGWIQHSYGYEGVCLMGAVRTVLYGGPRLCDRDPLLRDDPKEEKVEAMLKDELGGINPILWNDDRKRTKKQVLAFLEGK